MNKHESNLTTNVSSKELTNYQLLDLVKYIAAIMVICVHCNQLFPQEFLNYVIKNIICRVAVPFFFITSAYFVRKGVSTNPHYVASYLKKTTSSYLLWSLVFIPIGLDWIHQNLALAGNLLPFALLYGLIHIGTYYHLWYIPALIFSIFVVNKLLKYLSYRRLFLISMALFLFGSLETYYGLLPAGFIKDAFDVLIKIIFTTRSGLFYGMVFILMGFFLYDYREKLCAIVNNISKLTLLSALLLAAEGIFLYPIERLDMNFLIGLIPFSFFFFLWILSSPRKLKRDTRRIRELSKYYYFVHPVCIVMIEQLGAAYDIAFLSSGLISFLLILGFTHLLSTCILYMKKELTASRVIASALCGLMITFILASMIFLLKLSDVILKFEFVPCIWFASSFTMCALFAKKRSSAGKQKV